MNFTQLYVSIDASTKDALKAIDRPLHKDFWERFLASLKELAAKGQRTVYRLTLVKGWNAEEIRNYANLVSIGNPDFIEIKGVTYCGTSKGNNLKRGNFKYLKTSIYELTENTKLDTLCLEYKYAQMAYSELEPLVFPDSKFFWAKVCMSSFF